MKEKRILYGGDYNPEQWLGEPEILEKDVEYMKEAGINTVSMGMFSWSMLEPEEGVYRMEWLENQISRLYENGISTILSTPSGARPRWLAETYPEVLRVREDRVRQLFGERHNHCFTSPAYRRKVGQINGELAKRFGRHPAVILWHISNEYGGECHCPLCQQAFRQWLKERYKTVDRLNEVWSTTFWSRRYSSFEQVESPSSIGEWELHALRLDWNRFVSYQTADFARQEIRALKEAGITQPTTVNLMYDYQQLNYDKLAECVDIISWDSYPVWHETADILPAREHGMQHDYMRSLKHRPYLMMESCPSSLNWQPVSKLKKPGVLTAAGLQALAHGSDSILYFQIRQSRGASEKFHGAVIDHYGGRDTRVFKEVKAIGENLKKLAEIKGSRVKAEAAVIYDTENYWAIKESQGPRNQGMYYHEAVMKSYTALKKLGLNVDVISQAQEIDCYRFVAAPMLYLFQEGTEEKIRFFVEKGGIFVLTYWSGVADANDRCFLGKTPHGLWDVFGLRRAEIDGLFDEEKNWLVKESGRGENWSDGEAGSGETESGRTGNREAESEETGNGRTGNGETESKETGSGRTGNGQTEENKKYECRNLCELLEVFDARVLFRYGLDFYEGSPAVTEKYFGKGLACYVAADACQDFYDDFYRELIKRAEIRRIAEGKIPECVEISSRISPEWEYIFIQNFSKEAVDISGIEPEGEWIYGDEAKTSGAMKAYGTGIVRCKKAVENMRKGRT